MIPISKVSCPVLSRELLEAKVVWSKWWFEEKFYYAENQVLIFKEEFMQPGFS